MRTAAALLLPVLALLPACSKGPSTPAGPLGEVDLASRLPDGVSVPADAKSYDGSVQVCPGGKGDEPAKLHVSWKAFTKDGAGYVSSYAVELESGVSGLLVALDGDPKIANANARVSRAPLAVVTITLKCSRKMSSKSILDEYGVVFVRADGVIDTRK